MNFQELVNKIMELSKDRYKKIFAYEELEESIFGKTKVVHREGGEGEGEYWNTVRYFIDHNVYISLDGYYTSYNGTDFQGYELEEVYPIEKTIIVYEKK